MASSTNLIARSSGSIVFCKLEYCTKAKHDVWREYHTLNKQGFIYYIKDENSLQVACADNIFFYSIDQESLEPVLENVIDNYMDCNQLMFGPEEKYGITYKLNERSFQVFSKKYEHDFSLKLIDEDLEGSKCLELPSMDMFLISKHDRIVMYDIDTFKEIGDLALVIPET